MEFVDRRPSSDPSLAEQADALQKGLGRAYLWASAGLLAHDVLLKACLVDQRLDMQCEEGRAEWLWDLMQRMNASESFRGPLLQSLRNCTTEPDAYQLCGLIAEYAERGDAECLKALYDVVGSRQVPDAIWIGEGQLLAIEGLKAFEFIASVRGKELGFREWDWDDNSAVDRAIELHGEEAVREILDHASNAEVRTFGDACRIAAERNPGSEGVPSHAARMQAISIEEVLQAAKKSEKGYWLRGWGMRASDADLMKVFEVLIADSTPLGEIARLLRVFSNRPLPRFEPRILELCQSADEELRRSAFKALAKLPHPAVREFAIAQLRRGEILNAVRLFELNFAAGDEQLLLDALQWPEDPCLLHWMLTDVIHVLEANPGMKGKELAITAYWATPCQNCREDAAKWLIERRLAPQWLLEECAHDANEETRKLVADT